MRKGSNVQKKRASLSIKRSRRVPKKRKIEISLKQGEKTQLENESITQILLNAADDSVFLIDKSGIILALNEMAAKRLGKKTDEILGYSIYGFLPPDIAESRKIQADKVFHSGQPSHFEDGRQRQLFNNNVYPILDAAGNVVKLAVYTRNITEQKRAEEESKRTLSLLNATFDSTADGILVVNREGKMVSFNQKFARMWYIPESIIASRDDSQALAFVLEQLKNPEGFLAKVKALYTQPEAESFDIIEFKDGRIFERYSQPQRMGQEIVGRVWSFRDVTERRTAEETLLREKYFSDIVIDSLPGVFYVLDQNGNFVRWNKNELQVTEYSEDELYQINALVTTAEEDRDLINQKIQEVFEKGHTVVEAKVLTKSGKKIPYLLTGTRAVIKDQIYLLGMGIDITERKRAEEALHQANEILRVTLDAAPVAILDLDTEGRVQNIWNPAAERLLGWSRQEVLGRFFPAVTERGKEEFQKFRERLHAGEYLFGVDVHRQRKDGSPIDYSIYAAPLHDVHGQVTGNIAVLVDTTERKRTEESLRTSEEKYRSIFENAVEGIFQSTPEGKYISVNPAFVKMLGFNTPEETIHSVTDIAKQMYVQPEDRNRLIHLSNQQGEVKNFEAEIRRRDGSIIWTSMNVRPVRDKSGKLIYLEGMIEDITPRKQAEEAFKKERNRAQGYLDIAGVIFIVINTDQELILINKKGCEILGYEEREIIGKNWFDHFVPKQDRKEVKTTFAKLMAGEVEVVEYFENAVLTKSGEERIIAWHNTVVKDENGHIIGSLSSGEDVTEPKRREKEVSELQEQLRQSQKMEAIGQLAGGIAHDFNNLLTIIKGYNQLSLNQIKDENLLRENIEEIKKASDRAADLVSQLLAFSRRQIMEMRILDVNSLLKNFDKMLRRVIGEDIELVMFLEENLGTIKMDPGQIEQVIMNLAANARDAMPHGGKFTIETANVDLDEPYAKIHTGVKPGRYVMIAVSDTGMGMSAEVRERIFEPFFTTKEICKGTGLGLSTVYGIVKQSGGNIWVYSEPGQGTTFKIYLPRIDEPQEEVKEIVYSEDFPVGTETIIVVEDDEMVRKLSVRILQKQGYNVLQALRGEEALSIGKQYKDPIHLMLTDVVMPGMSGYDLAKSLESIHPEMKVLYMSGYTDNAIVQHGILKKGINFIQKPFSMDKLTIKIRKILDH